MTPQSSPHAPACRRRAIRVTRATRVAAAAALWSLPLTAFAPAETATQPASQAKFVSVFTDQFAGDSLNPADWVVFDGPGPRSARNVHVRNGKLILTTRKLDGQWMAAGVGSNRAVVQTYGKYEARVKVERGQGVRAVALLWPSAPVWPPEVDFFEIDDPARETNQLTLHYPPNNQMIHASVQSHFCKWHTVGVEWTPTALNYTLDGRVVSTMNAHIPNIPMWMGLQSGMMGGGQAPGHGTPKRVHYKVGWVRIWGLA